MAAIYLLYKFNIDTREAGSIGIIGGADGPTAIFLTGEISTYMMAFIFALFSIAGIACLIFLKRKR